MEDRKEFICQYIRQHKLAVVSTVNEDNRPESALVGIAVSDFGEIIFDTVTSSRKYGNIVHNPHVAVVIGWEDETTLQYEGSAEVLNNDMASDNYREIYYAAWPDGRERAETWPGLVHIKITPKWARYSNFDPPAVIEEVSF
ncbi:MAG TPA: pyridoxamine 5'-phosphate oxidase family protein [Mucilaginibacter sp.]|nr:pyridoxamine 5'-phosphate oxidase family protein [Mucilaginibacter sp.]